MHFSRLFCDMTTNQGPPVALLLSRSFILISIDIQNLLSSISSFSSLPRWCPSFPRWPGIPSSTFPSSPTPHAPNIQCRGNATNLLQTHTPTQKDFSLITNYASMFGLYARFCHTFTPHHLGCLRWWPHVCAFKVWSSMRPLCFTTLLFCPPSNFMFLMHPRPICFPLSLQIDPWLSVWRILPRKSSLR